MPEVGEQELINLSQNMIAAQAAVLLALHTNGDIDKGPLVTFLKTMTEPTNPNEALSCAPLLKQMICLLEADYSPQKPGLWLRVIQGGLADEPRD